METNILLNNIQRILNSQKFDDDKIEEISNAVDDYYNSSTSDSYPTSYTCTPLSAEEYRAIRAKW